MVITIRIIFSKHAKDKADGYGIDLEEVEQCVLKGMKWKEEKTGKWHASHAGFECVFQREEETIIIITIYQEAEK